MKIELEINDLEEYFFPQLEDYGYVSDKEIRDKFVYEAINRFAEQLYNGTYGYDYDYVLEKQITQIIKENKEAIISTVIDKVTSEILKKKDIVNNMPKKSEVTNISKEWEQYFIELIDKAIAKRFK